MSGIYQLLTSLNLSEGQRTSENCLIETMGHCYQHFTVRNIKNPKVEGRHPSIKQHLESALACVSHTGRIPKGILWFVTNVNHAVFYKSYICTQYVLRVGVGRNTCRQNKAPLNLLLWLSEFDQENKVYRGYRPHIIVRSCSFLALAHRIKRHGDFEHHQFWSD